MVYAFLIRHFLFSLSVTKAENIQNNYTEVLFQSDRESFIVVDKETKEIIDFNQHTVLLFELPVEINLTGIYISQLMMRYLVSDSVNLELLMNDIPDNWHGEATLCTHNKRAFNASINSTTYLKDDKKYQVLSIRDISEFKKTETELNYYKDKLEKTSLVKTRFLSSMSHELRTPLNGIIGSANLILAEQNLPEKVKTEIGLQLYSSEHMLSIINDILDFSKIESGKMELNKQSFNLMEALHFLINSIESQFRKNKIELKYNFDPKLTDILILSDVVKLRQILYNLLSNALKFTIDGNVIINVVLENTDTENITVSFNVKDTGIGIKKEKQAEIFEDFAQVHSEELIRRFGGTGLGLTISEKLVNLFGGKIKVESEYGNGANFYFTLTFKKAVTEIKLEEQPEENVHYTAPADIRGVRILVVEDNDINAAILIKFLQKWGIRIKEASHGVHALDLMKYHKFDLIMMDLEMPEMNGYTAAKIIRESNTEIPIIAFTATLLENMDALITENGFNDYILKPFRPVELKKKIEKFIQYRKIEYV